MTSSPQNIKLQLWNFSDTKGHEVNFPYSYNDYQKLLAKTDDGKRYTQDANKNLINLQYTFNALMNNKGLGNIIIDVDASKAKGEIVKAKDSIGVNEVILRNKMKTSEKIPLGLFRGTCGASSKGGVFNFSLFSDTTKECTPNEIMKQQVAFFPNTADPKGAFEKLFSDYSGAVNPLGYLFYFGTLVMNESRVVYRHGEGKMFRRMVHGGYETIEGKWGGGGNVNDDKYNDNFVSPAIACRVSNDGSGKTEGIAVGGNWLEGNYIGGSCLSWRVYFGNVVFNYTGALSDKYDKTQPIEGIVTFHKTQQLQGSESIINHQILESLLVRSFTVPVAVENEQVKKDFGIWVTFSGGNTPSSIYVGQFDANTFVESGYGVKIFLDDRQNVYIYTGSFSRTDYQLGTLYKIISKTPTTPDNVLQCTDFHVEVYRGRFNNTAITKDSKPLGVEDYKLKESTESKKSKKSKESKESKESKLNESKFSRDAENASLRSREAVRIFLLITNRCDDIYKTAIKNVDSTILPRIQQDNIKPDIDSEYAALDKYHDYISKGVDLVAKNLKIINGCSSDKSSLPQQHEIEAPITSMSQASPVQASSMQASPVQASPMQASPVQPPPMQAPSMQASPVQPPSMQASPVQASPVQPFSSFVLSKTLGSVGNIFEQPQTPSTSQVHPIQPRKSFMSGFLNNFSNTVTDIFRTPQQLSRANSEGSSAFQEQQQQPHYQPSQPQPLLMSSQPGSQVSLYQSSPVDSKYEPKYREQKQLAKLQKQQLRKQEQAQQQALFQAQMQSQLENLKKELSEKQQEKNQTDTQRIEIQDLKKQLEELKLRQQQPQSFAWLPQSSSMATPQFTFGTPFAAPSTSSFGASSTASVAAPSTSPFGAPSTGTTVTELSKQQQVQEQQPQQQQQVQENQQQPVSQPQVEEQPKPRILFISRFKLVTGGLRPDKKYIIALGQQFLCYNKDQKTAEQAALQTSGNYDNDDKVIDVINDNVEITLILPGKKFRGHTCQNAVLLRYTKSGAKIEQLFEFDPSRELPQPPQLAALIKQIQTKHAAKVQSEEAKSSMEQRLKKYRSELTELNTLLERLIITATDTKNESIVGLIDSISFKNLKENINTTKTNLENLISNSDNSTTEDDVNLAGAQVDSIIDDANVYMKHIIKEIKEVNLLGASSDPKTKLVIDVAKEISDKISLVLKSAAEARVAAKSQSVQSVSTTPGVEAVPAAAPGARGVAPPSTSYQPKIIYKSTSGHNYPVSIIKNNGNNSVTLSFDNYVGDGLYGELKKYLNESDVSSDVSSVFSSVFSGTKYENYKKVFGFTPSIKLKITVSPDVYANFTSSVLGQGKEWTIYSDTTPIKIPGTWLPTSEYLAAEKEKKELKAAVGATPAAAVGPAIATPDFNPKKMKEILMKKLRDMEYYEDVLNRLKELTESNTNSQPLFSSIEPLLKKIEINKTKLSGLISTLKDNYEVVPPTEQEVSDAKKAIVDANTILSKAKILKDVIITKADKICSSSSNSDSFECKNFEDIKERDEEWMKMNADENSTMTNMDTVVKEAEGIVAKVKQLANDIKGTQPFYPDSSGISLKDSDLTDVLKKYNDLKENIVTIDDLHKNAQKIQASVSAFDRVEFFKAGEYMDKVTELRTETYAYAANFTAKLSELMSKSASSILEKANDECGKVINAADQAKTSETTPSSPATPSSTPLSSTSSITDKSQFDKITGECKNLFELFKKLTTSTNAELWKSNEDMTLYNTLASSMMQSIKDKTKTKEVSNEFKKAGESIKTATEEKEKFEKIKSQVMYLESVIEQFIENTDEQYQIINSFDTTDNNTEFKTRYDALLNSLSEAKTAADTAFNVYSNLVGISSAPAASADNAPEQISVAQAKSDADKAYEAFNKIVSDIIALFTSAKDKLDFIIKNAKFKFIKEDAESRLKKLENFEGQNKNQFEAPKSELETKRQTVYKISDIQDIETKIGELRNKHTEISALKSATVELERKFTQESDKVFQAIADNAESQEVKEDKTTELGSLQTTIEKIVGDGTAAPAADEGPPSSPPQTTETFSIIGTQAQNDLSGLERDKKDIVSMYQFLKENNTAEFLDKKTTLKSIRDEAENKFKYATKIKGEIDAMVEKVNSKKTEIDEIIENYGEIRRIYSEAPVKDDNDDVEIISTKISTLETSISDITTIKNGLSSSFFRGYGFNTDKNKLASYAGAVISVLNSKLKQMKDQKNQLIADKAAEAKAASSASSVAAAPAPALTPPPNPPAQAHPDTHVDMCNDPSETKYFTFDPSFLSGPDKNIGITDSSQVAEQKNMSVNKCFWLRTRQYIPTGCDKPVIWAIKILSTYNYDQILMGVGLEKFVPITERFGDDDCKPISMQGFWGFSAEHNYTNSSQTTPDYLRNFQQYDVVFFTLSHVQNEDKKFKLHMFICPNNPNKNTMYHGTLDVDANVENGGDKLFPLVRFKSKGHKYQFLRVEENSLKYLENVGFSAGDLRAAGFTDEQLKTAGFTDEQLKSVTIHSPVNEAMAAANPVGIGDTNPVGIDDTNPVGIDAGAPRFVPDDGDTGAGVFGAVSSSPPPVVAAADNAITDGVADVRRVAIDNYVNKLNDPTRKEKIKQIVSSTNNIDFKNMREKGVTASEMVTMGIPNQNIINAGFTAAELKKAGFTAIDLKDGKIPIGQIVNAGYSEDQLKAAGFKKSLLGLGPWSGGKSGSSITRKRRLRLKKSRNITRHKGGKKSVRFSARVKLNNGTGKGNGNCKGTSSMNKRTRKVSSSSYKLIARRMIKLKR